MRSLTLLFSLAICAAAASITGTIRDPDGRPVAGAAVRIDGAPATRTGEDGGFQLAMEAAGAHTLVAESPAFVTVEQRIVADGADVRVDLVFRRLASQADSVTVTADAAAGDVLNPDPAQNVVIRDQSMDANPGRPVETASGGIKAPQYFAPGVAGDHGETIAQFFQVGAYLAPNNLSANA